MKKIFILALLVTLSIFGYWLYMIDNSRISPHSGSAAGSLKSSIFSSQVQFQAGCYLDDNKNGVGEYGFINQLSGDEPVPPKIQSGDLGLITGQLDNNVHSDGDSFSNGYHFRIYLPDGRGGMYTMEEYRQDPHKDVGAELRERFYLALAWPEDTRKHRRIYAMGPDGQLCSTSLSAVRDAFIAYPSWKHFYKRLPDTIEEINRQWPSDKWSFYSK